MTKPLIGVSPLWDEKKDSLWMLPGYLEGIINAGGIPLILPLTNDEAMIVQLSMTCDGFLFTGGHDISPKLYGEKPLAQCGVLCEKRDLMEQLLFKKSVLEQNKPSLGICRGIQLFNVLLGGSLYQDLPTQYESRTKHQQSPPYDEPVHQVNILKDTPLQKLFMTSELDVNSYHHQAIHQLSDQLKPMALSNDGLIEAVYMPNRKYVCAVQWHPELMSKNIYSCRLFESLVNSCLRHD